MTATAIAVGLGMSACNKSDSAPGSLSFSVSGIKFQDGDRIKILYGLDASGSVTATAADGVFTLDSDLPSGDAPCIAVFPDNRSCTVNGEPILENLEINYSQTGLTASLKNARIYAAQSTLNSGHLDFICQSGIVKFSVKSEDAYSTEFIFGTDVSTGLIQSSPSYLPVRPGTQKTSALRVKLKTGEDYPSLAESTPLTVMPSQILDFGTVEDQVFSESAAGSKSLRAMSFNILRGDLNGPDHLWTVRKDACLALITARQADILGTVECNSVQKEDILRANPQYGAVGLSVNGDFNVYPSTSSNSIYYDSDKLLLERWGTLWLSETPDKPSYTFYCTKGRTLTWAQFKLKQMQSRFIYICIHLQDNSSGMAYPYSEQKEKYGPDNRRRSAELIADRIDEINPQGYPLVLGGDLNCTYDASELESLRKIFSLVADIAATSDKGNTFNGFTSAKGKSRIDHMFSSSCTHSLFAVDRNAYEGQKYCSDHFPIFTDFTLNSYE